MCAYRREEDINSAIERGLIACVHTRRFFSMFDPLKQAGFSFSLFDFSKSINLHIV